MTGGGSSMDKAWRGENTQHLATCSSSGQRWEVRLDANTGRGRARTMGQCPAKSFIWQASGISKLENQQDQIHLADRSLWGLRGERIRVKLF